MLLRFSLNDDLVQGFDIVSLMLINDDSSPLGLLSAFLLRWAAGRDLVIILVDLDLYWLIAIGADRLFILEAIEAEVFIMLLAHKPLNFDYIFLRFSAICRLCSHFFFLICHT